jgi:hypothetical protein
LFEGSVPAGSRRVLALDAGRWPSGIYFLRVSGETFAKSRKIVVVH